jgi:hypothetical protein
LEKRDIIEKWSPQDWREFDRWIKANAIIGSLLAAGLFAMAVAGAPSAGSGDAAAAARQFEWHGDHDRVVASDYA